MSRMRNMKAQASLLALAAPLCLAGCAAASASQEPATSSDAPPAQHASAPAQDAPAAAPTVADAETFVAMAERELSELSVIGARAQWVNATYITPDTDALATHFGTLGTELQVRLANEAARFANVPGLSYDTQRKLNILRTGLV